MCHPFPRVQDQPLFHLISRRFTSDVGQHCKMKSKFMFSNSLYDISTALLSLDIPPSNNRGPIVISFRNLNFLESLGSKMTLLEKPNFRNQKTKKYVEKNP